MVAPQLEIDGPQTTVKIAMVHDRAHQYGNTRLVGPSQTVQLVKRRTRACRVVSRNPLRGVSASSVIHSRLNRLERRPGGSK